MRCHLTLSDQPLTLVTEIASSGEGAIWETDRPGVLAKIYHHNKRTPERFAKLEVMIQDPPRDPTAPMHHVSLAWPTDIVADTRKKPIGFIMPAIQHAKSLITFSSPLLRKRNQIVSWYFLYHIARNLCAIIRSVHRRGYVIGDLKDENILVNERALPAIVDCDSFQVRHKGTTHLSPVGTAGFTAPETIGTDFSSQARSVSSDRFALAVIIHQLLFGDHPFSGNWKADQGASDEPPDINVLIRDGHCRYNPTSQIQPAARTVGLRTVHPALRKCFYQAFVVGHNKPHRRPSARAWEKALHKASRRLHTCRIHPSHVYDPYCGPCPWCDLKATQNIELFPAAEHLQRHSAGGVSALGVFAPPLAPPRWLFWIKRIARWLMGIAIVATVVALLWYFQSLILAYLQTIGGMIGEHFNDSP
ncbi:MAG: hypothetical protein EA401_07485 [Planctomycetota bacterium]|nr:MAG: hypothetical protein EA401_07485 [Planctomycetota bacterium]